MRSGEGSVCFALATGLQREADSGAMATLHERRTHRGTVDRDAQAVAARHRIVTYGSGRETPKRAKYTTIGPVRRSNLKPASRA